MNQVRAVTRAALRELTHRRAALVVVALLPLAFYLARHELPGQSVRMLVLGLGWAVATLALFGTVGSLGLDRRLRIAGYPMRALVIGRLVAMILAGLGLSAGYLLLVTVDQDLQRTWAVGLMMLCAITVAAPLGMAVGLLLKRELEGALGLLTVLATQMIADPDGTLAKFLPFWSVRQLATYAIEETGTSYVTSGLVT
ncbi:hypothetical protein [Blastococcus sp. Marseille-P5729]|uniref:hypothetical protein n=1 Tax=Blastococcus sp. Marseille-P5729 TaxID=2086582 RepID=UPI000D0EAD96|nr:hypothetical protein [Blastococcus sp. Marseille-P5729]